MYSKLIVRGIHNSVHSLSCTHCKGIIVGATSRATISEVRFFSAFGVDGKDSTKAVPITAAQCKLSGTGHTVCDFSIPGMGDEKCVPLDSSLDQGALTKLLLVEIIELRKGVDASKQKTDALAKKFDALEKKLDALKTKFDILEKKADASDKQVREHNRMIFLGDLSLWVRGTHLKDLVDSLLYRLTAITGNAARKTEEKAGRQRLPNLLDYIPGVVDFLNAGKDTNAMWLNDEDLRALAVQNYEIIAEVTKPWYDVALILQQSAGRNEQFHVTYPILRSNASKVEALGRFLKLAPSYMHTLQPEDQPEVQRKLDVLKSLHKKLRVEVTENAVNEVYGYSTKSRGADEYYNIGR